MAVKEAIQITTNRKLPDRWLLASPVVAFGLSRC
jgi:hypothetical protein